MSKLSLTSFFHRENVEFKRPLPHSSEELVSREKLAQEIRPGEALSGYASDDAPPPQTQEITVRGGGRISLRNLTPETTENEIGPLYFFP